MPKQAKILFILPYPIGFAPSQRFRVEAFFPLLQEHGFQIHNSCFFSEADWEVLYKKGSLGQKTWAVTRGFASRLALLAGKVWCYDYIFIHREASPLGPPFVEWFLAKVGRKKFIYDFDDAIWIPNTSKENRIVGWIKAFWKVRYNCSWAYKVVGGNEYLIDYARRYNNNVVSIPTCVDVEARHNKLKDSVTGKLTIGWTGSHSTLHYLDEVIPVIKRLQDEFDFDFIVIANQAPVLPLKNWTFIPWQEKTEIEDLLKLDIGIMPLKPDTWSEGKCGFKLIQYLALGIPAVASTVGVNSKIINQGQNGFLCTTTDEWYLALRRLLQDINLRNDLGIRGRKKIVEEYSIQSQEQTFLKLFS
ncbi:MAG: glycosyltransferase [Chitinophagaceae bacterium]|nr:MAG: glycosyltransferase [Chitinophagaceae bacterium]